jgi:competence protein ComGC
MLLMLYIPKLTRRTHNVVNESNKCTHNMNQSKLGSYTGYVGIRKDFFKNVILNIR